MLWKQSFSPETTIYNCQGNVKENSLKALKGLAQLNSPGSILQEIIRTTHSCDMAYNFHFHESRKEKISTSYTFLFRFMLTFFSIYLHVYIPFFRMTRTKIQCVVIAALKWLKTQSFSPEKGTQDYHCTPSYPLRLLYASLIRNMFLR